MTRPVVGVTLGDGDEPGILADVDPALCGQAPHAKLGRVDRRRDDFELALTREAVRRDLPILAICRGIRVSNVAAGGTLGRDIPSIVAGAVKRNGPGPRWRRAHQVEVTRSSRLRAILGQDAASVNSIHHQGIDRVGHRACGRRHRGIVGR